MISTGAAAPLAAGALDGVAELLAELEVTAELTDVEAPVALAGLVLVAAEEAAALDALAAACDGPDVALPQAVSATDATLPATAVSQPRRVSRALPGRWLLLSRVMPLPFPSRPIGPLPMNRGFQCEIQQYSTGGIEAGSAAPSHLGSRKHLLRPMAPGSYPR